MMALIDFCKKTFTLWLIVVGCVQFLSAQCYTVAESNSGIVEIHNDPDLESKACEVQTFLGTTNFKIIGYDFYPILAYVDPIAEYDRLFEEAITASDQYEGYILIAKGHDVNGNVGYRLHIKYMALEAFNNINPIDRAAIGGFVEEELNRVSVLNSSSSVFSAEAEFAALTLFINMVQNGVSGDDVLEAAGFYPIEFGSQTISVDADGNTSATGKVRDYAGVIDNNTGSYIRDNALSKANDAIFKPMLIFTSDIDNVSAPNLEAAQSDFDNSSEAFIFWFHFKDENTAYYKVKANISQADANTIMDLAYGQYIHDIWEDGEGPAAAAPGGNQGAFVSSIPDCADKYCELASLNSFKVENLKRWSTYCCILPSIGNYDLEAGVSLGIIDGLVQTLFFIYDVSSGLREAKENDPFSLSWWGDAIVRCYNEASFVEGFKSKIGDTYAYWKGVKESVGKIVKLLDWSTIYNGVTSSLKAFIGVANPFVSGLKGTGYAIGILAFEVLLTFFTGGSGSIRNISSFSKKALESIKKLSSPAAYKNLVADGLKKSTDILRKLKLNIRLVGCFVKDTPVLMANNNYKVNFTGSPFRNTKALAVAAVMPIVAVPIQEVQLLDYAVAHETVNATYGLTASVDDDIYLGLMDKDPYTSDQQRERDEYEINDTDWNEVVFEEVNGSSTAKLALHNDWINKKGYQVDGVVNLDLPEQGISGPFKITSIKHIIPQKKPTVDDDSDDYDYKPVTGLFIHAASDVWNIKFDNGEELGVTHNHPIYSTTIGDWQFAGMLQIGEEVLTKEGGAIVVSKEIGKAQQVYNIEVKDYHNFLVNDSGIVVHNNGLCSYLKSLFTKYSKWHKAEPDWGLNDNFITQVMGDMVNNPTSIKGVTTTTYNGKTYLIEGHHRLRAAKRLKTEQGIDFELQHYDINPDKINTITPHNNIEEFIQNTFLPDE